MKVEWVPLREVCRFDRTPIDILPSVSYRKIGILSWGKGLIRYPETPGTEMGSMRYFEFPRSSLMFSNIQAWEGAVARTTPSEDEYVCSSRFFPYVPRHADAVDLRYLLEFFRSDQGLEVMRRCSTGTQVRNKVLNRKLLESAPVPIPPLDDQHRIAEHLDDLSRSATTDGKSAAAETALATSTKMWLDSLPRRRLIEVAEFAPKPTRVDPSDAVTFVPMAAVDAETGTITDAKTRIRSEFGAGYRQFSPGDVIFARITPCMQNGNCAIYSDAEHKTAYGSSEFFVLRPHNELMAEWLWLVLRSTWFTDRAKEAFTGTAGQQRVPASFMKTIEIPWPEDTEERASVDRLRGAADIARNADALRRRRDELASAILPAARNEIFRPFRIRSA